MGSINWKNKCWVATVFLVNDKNEVLLTWNNNLQNWIPVGGHIDEGETPEEAVIREVSEETGFVFDFVSPHGESDGRVRPMKNQLVQIEEVPHHNHHMNFIFYGKCTKYHEKETTDEEEKLRWFSKEELIKEKDSFFPNVWRQSVDAIEVVSKDSF